jgi:hypothetical protein
VTLAGQALAYDDAPRRLDSTDPSLALQDRFDRREDDVSVRLGDFAITPSVIFDESLNDNIFATRNGRVADIISTADGRVHAATIDGDHRLSFDGGLLQNYYAFHPSENAWEGRAQLNYQQPIRNDLQFFSNADVERRVLPRTDPTGLQGTRPETYRLYIGSLGLIAGLAPGRSLIATAGVNRSEFDNVPGLTGIINAKDRNHTETYGSLRVEQLVTARRAWYAVVRVDNRTYDLTTDFSGFRRGSNGGRGYVGATYDPDGTLTLTLEGGLEVRSYEDMRFGTFGEPVGVARAVWFPTRLTRVQVEAKHDYEEDIYFASVGARRTVTELRVDHELRRAVLLTGRLEYDYRDLIGSPGGTVRTAFAESRVQYQFADGYSVAGDYVYSRQRGTGTTTLYDQNVVMLTFRKDF